MGHSTNPSNEDRLLEAANRKCTADYMKVNYTYKEQS